MIICILSHYYNRNIECFMEESYKTWRNFSNKELKLVSKYRDRIREIEQQTICNNIIAKDTNRLDFYIITPREELPKYLQKMKFQTLHLKEKDIANSVKIFKKENRRPLENQLRNKLKTKGHLMLLSEIYQFLGEPGDPAQKHIVQSNPTENIEDLDEWQKIKKEEKLTTLSNLPKRNVELQVSQLISKDERKSSIDVHSRLFQNGSDFKIEIQKALAIIEMTHSSEYNQMNRYVLVENSSKILKKELDDKKSSLQQTIKNKMKLLYQARFEYHNGFEQKNQLQLQQRLLNQEYVRQDKDGNKLSHKSISTIKLEKHNEHKMQKKWLIDANSSKIAKIKKNIQTLEESIANLEEELRKIIVAEKLYYKLSLKNGNDVRQNGLVWIIKKLQIREEDMNHYEYPQFLDKKCRLFLIQKALTEEEADHLLEEKRKFVNQIGRSSSESKRFKNLLSPKELLLGNDRIVENDISYEPVPKKYRRSIRKISQLNQEYQKNSCLLQHHRDKNKLIEISADLDGLSNKQIYTQIGQRIKHLDLSKLKKDKIGSKKMRLLEYQSLLEKIKNIHIKLEEMDMQLEHHLLSHYKDNRNLYFMQAAACFGYKRAYTMIIKHFSWKTYHEHHE